MKFLTYSGNNIIHAHLPDRAEILYAPASLPGIRKRDVPQAVVAAFRNPLGMPPLPELVNASSKILIVFDDNCQPFPKTSQPDIRRQAMEALLPMLYACGVKKENLRLICAVALHRKMKEHELSEMVGPRIMRDFYPGQLGNWDAEDPDDIARLGETEQGEPVEVCRAVVESDLSVTQDRLGCNALRGQNGARF